MEEEIIIVIKPKRAQFVGLGSANQIMPEPAPSAYSFDTYEAAVKFLAANLKG